MEKADKKREYFYKPRNYNKIDFFVIPSEKFVSFGIFIKYLNKQLPNEKNTNF